MASCLNAPNLPRKLGFVDNTALKLSIAQRQYVTLVIDLGSRPSLSNSIPTSSARFHGYFYSSLYAHYLIFLPVIKKEFSLLFSFLCFRDKLLLYRQLNVFSFQKKENRIVEIYF